MTIFELINACELEWDVIRIFTDGDKEDQLRDLGSFFEFAEIPEELRESEVDTWTVNTYNDGGKVCEISIII